MMDGESAAKRQSASSPEHVGVRAELIARYKAVRAGSDDLARGLTPEDAQVQSMADASPTKWHLAHTTWFFETFLLIPNLAQYAAFDPNFGYLFNSYYEAVGPRHARPQRGLITRPGLDRVIAYRAYVDQALVALIGNIDDAQLAAIGALIKLGLNHEQQHQELILMDIKHAFSCSPLEPPFRVRNTCANSSWAAPLEWIAFEGGLRRIGHDGDRFAFDNESPRHKVWLEPFSIADRLATAGDYLAFIADGGYRRAEFWLSDGWAAAQSRGWTAPLYWFEDAPGDWSVFSLEGRRAVELSEPVCHLSFYEADAFARWSGARLPTEAEWEVASTSTPAVTHDLHLHPSASEMKGLRQMHGEVWQWTASAYLPYPGFRPAAGAVGEYNGKFMSGQMVLRGSACVTPDGHARATYRNFFPPDARWAFSGVRLAQDA